MQNFFLTFVNALTVLFDCLPEAEEVFLDAFGEGSEIDIKVEVGVMILFWVHVNKFIANIIL